MNELRFEDYYALLERYDKAISGRHKAGESYRQIADDLGISTSAAQRAARDWERSYTQRNLMWQREIAERRKRGESYKTIADAMGLKDVRIVEYHDGTWRRRFKARMREQFKKQVIEYGYA